MKSKSRMVALVIGCLQAATPMGFAGQPIDLQLKNGTVVECQSAEIAGGKVIAHVKYGTETFDLSSISKQSIDALGSGNPGLLAGAASTTGTDQPMTTPSNNGDSNHPKPNPSGVQASQAPPPASTANASPPQTGAPAGPFLEEDIPHDLAEGSHLNLTPQFNVTHSAFTVPTNVKGNPTVQVEVLAPTTNDGETPASASEMVYFAPYINYGGSWEKKDTGYSPGSNRYFWELAEVYGLTVYTIHFLTDESDVDSRSECFYYPESGSFDVVFDVRNQLIKRFNLQKERLLVFGDSGGASMAQKMGLYCPNDVAAVAMLGGGRLDPVIKRNDVDWCILNTRGDTRSNENAHFASECRNIGMNAIYAETEPPAKKKSDFDLAEVHHTADTLGLELMQQYLAAIAKMQEANVGGKIPAFTKWPARAPSTQPFRIEKNTGNGVGSGPMDFYFPTMEFANLWQEIPYRTVKVPSSKNNSLNILVRYPAIDTKGVVVFNGGSEMINCDIGDYLDYIAGRGYISLTSDFASGEAEKLHQTESLAQWTLARLNWKSYPIYLIGVGTGGRHANLSASSITNNRIGGIGAYEPPLDWPFDELSPIRHISGCNYPLFLVEVPGTRKEEEAQAFAEYASRCSKSVNIASVAEEDPFDFLEKILNIFDSGSSLESTGN